MNSLTIDEVKAIHEGHVKRANPPAGWDPRLSTRVRVHEELKARNPHPCSSITDEMMALRQRGGTKSLSHVERERQLAHQRAQTTEEQHDAYARAKASRDPSVLDGKGELAVLDAHHHVQKLHGMALWAEADRLVGEAVSQ